MSTLPLVSLYRSPKDVALFWESNTWISSHCAMMDEVGSSSLIAGVWELRCCFDKSTGREATAAMIAA